MEIDYDDDWENAEIPDLLISIKNKEREIKLLEERKLMEEAELVLAEELFSDKKINESLNSVELIKFNECLKPRSKELKILQEKRRQQLEEKQKQQSIKQKAKKQQQKRQYELYGEANIDEYDEMYGYIEEKY